MVLRYRSRKDREVDPTIVVLQSPRSAITSFCQCSPQQVITVDTVREVLGLESIVIDDPVSHTPLVIPISALGSLAPKGAEGSVGDDFERDEKHRFT